MSLMISFNAKIGERVHTITIDKGSTIHDAKQQLASESNVDVGCQKWIYKGRILNDNNCTISDANIKENDTVIVMKTAAAASSSSSTTTPTPSTMPSIPSTPTTPILPSSVFSPPVFSNPAFDEAMFLLLDSNTDTSVIENAINIINKIIMNIISNPHNDKYRKISKTNKTFSQKVQAIKGGEEIMRSLSFQTVGDDYILQPSASAWDNLIASKTKLDRFAQKLQQQQSSSSSTSPTKVDTTQDSQKLSSTTNNNDNNDNNNDKTLVALQQMLSILALQQNNTDGISKDTNEKDNEKE